MRGKGKKACKNCSSCTAKQNCDEQIEVEKTFVATFDGQYNKRTKKFSNWSNDPLESLGGISQEIIHQNKLVSMLATSFKMHRVHNSRPAMYCSLDLFSSNTPKETQKELTYILFQNLAKNYDKKGKGKDIAIKILTIAWETVHLMRLMFLKYVPDHEKAFSTNDDESIGTFLTKRLNFHVINDNGFVLNLISDTDIKTDFFLTVENVSKINKYLNYVERSNKDKNKTKKIREKWNTFVFESSGMNLIITDFSVTQVNVSQIANYLLKTCKKTKKKIAEILEISPNSLNKLLENNKKMTCWKNIAELIDTEQKVRYFFQQKDLDDKCINDIIDILKHPIATP